MGATVGALLRKELLVELRTLESVPGMSLFAVTTFVVFHFALNRNSVDGDLAAGILWVTLLFAAILGVNRLFVADADQGGFDGFLLAPVDRSAMLLAKALALLAYLAGARARRGARLRAAAARPVARAGAAGPARGARARRPRRGRDRHARGGARGAHARARPAGPLLALPLLVPVVIGAARASAPLFALTHATAPPARWLLTLGLYDLVFGLIAFALFDFLLED